MVINVLIATFGVATLSLVGAFLFGHSRRLVGVERYVIPAAVGVFMALVFIELIPETLAESPEWGGVGIGLAFIGVYVLAHVLHVHLHNSHHNHNEKQEAALLVLFGDAFHNFADGVVIAGGFLISPEVGWAVTAAVAMHEVPQEIVEFGILIKVGYSRTQAMLRNFLSASTVVVGAAVTLWLAVQFTDLMWVVTAFVAGNMLYIAASELLPRLHGARDTYNSFTGVVFSILLGFSVMTAAIMWSHEHIMPEGMHEHDHAEELDHDEEGMDHDEEHDHEVSEEHLHEEV